MSRSDILLWCPQGCGQNYHGPGMNMYRLFSSFKDTSYKVHLAHCLSNHDDKGVFSSYHYIHSLFRSNKNIGYWDLAMYYKKSREWIKCNASHYSIFMTPTSFDIGISPAAYAQKMGLPAIARVAGHQSDLSIKPGLNRLMGRSIKRRRKVKNLSAMVAISRDIELELLSYGVDEKKIVYIPNGVDTNLFAPLESYEKKQRRLSMGLKDIPTVVFCGTLCQRKNPHLIVEGIINCLKEDREIQGLFIGPPGEEAYSQSVLEMMKSTRFHDRFHYVGHQVDVIKYYQMGDIFVLPSQNEGMPNALVEAMSCGLVPIVTPISGSKDLVVDGKVGFFIGENIDDLSDKLKMLLDDEKLWAQHVVETRKRIVDKFSLVNSVALYEKLYENILSGKR